MNRIVPVLPGLCLLVCLWGCGGADADPAPTLQLDTYRDLLKTFTPSIDAAGAAGGAGRSAVGNQAVNSNLFTNLLANVPDAAKRRVLLRNWIGWDNDASAGTNVIVFDGETIAPAEPDGWMPFRESVTGRYYATNTGDAAFAGVGTPGLKSYAIMNKVFFGNGSDTVYGAAAFMDRIVDALRAALRADYGSQDPLVTVDKAVAGITLPAWFGGVEDTHDGAPVSAVSVTLVADLSAYAPAGQVVKVAFRRSGGVQVIVVYQQAADSVSLTYARRDTAGTGQRMYVKFARVSFQGGAWNGSHLGSIKSTGAGKFLVRKANQLPWNEGGNDTYSHSLAGAGGVASGDYVGLRWTEVKYDRATYGLDPDAATLANRIKSDNGSDLYFIFRYDSGQAWNDRYVPLYGDVGRHGPNGSGGPVLPDAPDNTSVNGHDYGAYDTYLHLDQRLSQAEIPGNLDSLPADFPGWTVY